MGTKVGLILGAGIGFVLGARAGREKYEQIKAASRQVRRWPIVARPLDAAGEKTADIVRNKGNEISDAFAEAVKQKLFGMPAESLVIEATVVDEKGSAAQVNGQSSQRRTT